MLARPHLRGAHWLVDILCNCVSVAVRWSRARRRRRRRRQEIKAQALSGINGVVARMHRGGRALCSTHCVRLCVEPFAGERCAPELSELRRLTCADLLTHPNAMHHHSLAGGRQCAPDV